MNLLERLSFFQVIESLKWTERIGDVTKLGRWLCKFDWVALRGIKIL